MEAPQRRTSRRLVINAKTRTVPVTNPRVSCPQQCLTLLVPRDMRKAVTPMPLRKATEGVRIGRDKTPGPREQIDQRAHTVHESMVRRRLPLADATVGRNLPKLVSRTRRTRGAVRRWTWLILPLLMIAGDWRRFNSPAQLMKPTGTTGSGRFHVSRTEAPSLDRREWRAMPERSSPSARWWPAPPGP